jgi:hypothetical protein
MLTEYATGQRGGSGPPVAYGQRAGDADGSAFASAVTSAARGIERHQDLAFQFGIVGRTGALE